MDLSNPSFLNSPGLIFGFPSSSTSPYIPFPGQFEINMWGNGAANNFDFYVARFDTGYIFTSSSDFTASARLGVPGCE